MKILQAIYQFQTGGGSLQVVTNLAKAAREAGHSVTVLSKDVAISSEVGGERFFTGNKVWDWYRWMNHLRQQQYDIVHVHDRYCSLLLSLIPHHAASVQTNHFAYANRRRFTQFAQCVVGCSQAMDQHHAQFFGLPASRRAMIQNGVYFREPDQEQLSNLRQSSNR